MVVPNPLKLLLDEDLSPRVARSLCEEDGGDAVGVRDRGQLGASDRAVLDLAFAEDRVLVTANVRDFERLVRAREIHCGIVFVRAGDLDRAEQLAVVRRAIAVLCQELARGGDLINRVLYMEADGSTRLELLPAEPSSAEG